MKKNEQIKELEKEYLLLKKMIYKNRNQHRSTKYFKSMVMLFKSLDRFLNGSNKYEEIISEYEKLNGELLKCKRAQDINHETLNIFFNNKFAFFIELCRKAKVRSFHAARQFTSLLSTRYFLPFAVVCLACVSKIGMLLKTLFQQLYEDQFYSLTALWLGRSRDLCKTLPNSMDLAKFVLESIQKSRFLIKQFSNNNTDEIITTKEIEETSNDDFGEKVTYL